MSTLIPTIIVVIAALVAAGFSIRAAILSARLERMLDECEGVHSSRDMRTPRDHA